MSREFCIETANTLAACGIKAYIFDSLRTTPELSFAIRNLNAISGIVITASHNPQEYNGYKVYWEDGAQVMPHIANAITEEINSIVYYSTIPTLTDKNKDLIIMLDEKQDKDFIEAVKKQVIRKELVNEIGKEFKIVYTPLCGTGNIPIRRALKEIGFENVIVVKEEENPDPNFADIEYPNPEDQKALDRGIKLATEVGADLVIATDPDCDRVGVAVRTLSGEYALLTGNQIGGMLTNYIIESLKEKNELKSNSTLIKTIVTSEFGADIAKSNNIEVLNVLTGFKFIGEKIKLFEENNEKTYLFGYEESYGYLVGTHARDKDAIVATMALCEAAAYYKKQGKTLWDQMLAIYDKYGYYKDSVKSVTMKGIEGLAKIAQTMENLRANAPENIGPYKVLQARDYKLDTCKNMETGEVTPTGLPQSNVLYYDLEDGAWLCVRPSGTEPKIKLYYGVKGSSMEDAENRSAELGTYAEALLG